MSRGNLPDTVYDSIHSKLPDVLAARHAALTYAPDWLSFKFPPRHRAPETSVCLHDCTSILCEVRHALFEYLAHGQYYREYRQPPDALVAVAMERFYLDDAALRLYAAAESLAVAVICMLDVPEEKVREYRERGASDKATLGKYLRREAADHPLAQPLFELHALPEWQFTISYRNRWVHEQPPTIAGEGIIYRRGPRWKFDADGNPAYLAMTKGDRPELTIEALATNILRANELFVGVVNAALAYYEQIVVQQGFQKHPDGRVSFTLFE